jgi:hypothetical protein
MTKISYLIILLVLSSLRVNAQIDIYVSPLGNDLNIGTKDQPLISLIGARNAIREYKRNHIRPVSFVVTIADGSYIMKEPLVLTHEDGGTVEFPIIYRAEKGTTPVFSGGEKNKWIYNKRKWCLGSKYS